MEEDGLYLPCKVVLLSEPVSQYRCLNPFKTDDSDTTQKIMQIPYLDTWLVLLSGQVPLVGAIEVTCFGILKNLCQLKYCHIGGK